MIFFVVSFLVVAALARALTFLLTHERRESARNTSHDVQIRQMRATAQANRLIASDYRWTDVDDRQLARYISEVSS